MRSGVYAFAGEERWGRSPGRGGVRRVAEVAVEHREGGKAVSAKGADYVLAGKDWMASGGAVRRDKREGRVEKCDAGLAGLHEMKRCWRAPWRGSWTYA